MVQIGLEHLGEEYVLGARAPLGNPNWKGPWDCAEFASWCLFQATRIIFGARPRTDPMLADPYTGFWGDDAEAAERHIGGVIVSVEQAARITGAFVLRKPSSIRRVGHIVISDGGGGTVEAMSARHGVRRASLSNRSWDYGILVPRVRYLMNEVLVTVTPASNVLRVTTPLTFGSLVEAVQKALVAHGFSPGRIDGIYGGQTAHAVAAFQAANGLVVDGEAGDETLGALGLRSH